MKPTKVISTLFELQHPLVFPEERHYPLIINPKRKFWQL